MTAVPFAAEVRVILSGGSAMFCWGSPTPADKSWGQVSQGPDDGAHRDFIQGSKAGELRGHTHMPGLPQRDTLREGGGVERGKRERQRDRESE